MTKDTGGQAFPDALTFNQKGMTLRDYFQSNIMNGFASQMPMKDIVAISEGTKGGRYYLRASKILADAMIAERSK